MDLIINIFAVLAVVVGLIWFVISLVRFFIKKAKNEPTKLIYISRGPAVVFLALMVLAIVNIDNDESKANEPSQEEIDDSVDREIERQNDEINNMESNEDDTKQFVVESSINTTINDFVEENFQFDTVATEIEVNENLGTDKKDDYITLVHMDMPKVLSVEKGYGWIEKYSNYLASEMAEKEPDVSELVIFWTMAGSENNVAKYVLHREKDKFIFDSQWQDPNFKD